MKLVGRLWTTLTHIINTLIGSPFEEAGQGLRQQPILPEPLRHALSTSVSIQTPVPVHTSRPVKVHDGYDKPGPIFAPPGRDLGDDGSNFTCDYSAMVGWTECSTPSNRGCWLQNPSSGASFDVNTNYEADTPIGITREYFLTVGPQSLNLDGQEFPAGKVFRSTSEETGSYPGPWIQACWGDTVQVTVTVDDATDTWINGTSVHWHGIRQWLTMHMDGVPGVSQCPIAPGSSYTYSWRARQYGSSWYHSHFTLQYADGLLGALTIHGPSTAAYDQAGAIPLLLSDWDHTSAFQLNYNVPSNNPTVLLNGIGDITKTYSGVTPVGLRTPTTIVFQNGTRYLLRIINTSFGTPFLFTIDNHMLQVVSADFVPIQPYGATHIVVAIGQRYNIIVTATPTSNGSVNPVPTDNNFWIRAYALSEEVINLKKVNLATYNEVGIVRYDSTSTTDPKSAPWDPDFQNYNYTDETGIIPWFPWFVGNQSNPPSSGLLEPVPEEHGVQLMPDVTSKEYPVAAFAITTPTPTPVQLMPFRIQWDNITFQNMDNVNGWPAPWVLIAEDGTPDEWCYLLFQNSLKPKISHPLHLHGHDFAILSQSPDPYVQGVTKLNLINPPRRDVVTLYGGGGHVVIAFRTDNPGAWLFHCHIALHASKGLALQILENRVGATLIWPTGASHALNVSKQLCTEWTTFVDKVNPDNANPWFQDDSGI